MIMRRMAATDKTKVAQPMPQRSLKNLKGPFIRLFSGESWAMRHAQAASMPPLPDGGLLPLAPA
jgi:hypothetical protein